MPASSRQFQIFDLRVWQQLSVQETARLLQASVASVCLAKHRVARLVKKGGAQVGKERVLRAVPAALW